MRLLSFCGASGRSDIACSIHKGSNLGAGQRKLAGSWLANYKSTWPGYKRLADTSTV